MSLSSEAEFFAQQCHAGQFRKYGRGPYIEHPRRVGERLRSLGASEELIAAGYLHDVIEDCDIPYGELVFEFGVKVADIVREVTNVKEPGLNRRQQKEKDRERLKNASPEAKLLKLVDRIDNLRELDWNDSFAMVYASESELLAYELRDASMELYEELIQLVNDIYQGED